MWNLFWAWQMFLRVLGHELNAVDRVQRQVGSLPSHNFQWIFAFHRLVCVAEAASHVAKCPVTCPSGSRDKSLNCPEPRPPPTSCFVQAADRWLHSCCCWGANLLFAVAAATWRFSGFAVKLSDATVGRVVCSPERQKIMCLQQLIV